MNNSYSGYSYNPSGASVQSSKGQGANMYNPNAPHSSYGSYGPYNFDNDNRLIGAGFAFPFLLGGVTGAAIAPAFWRPPYNRPYYGPGPFYGSGPFYGPYRPF